MEVSTAWAILGFVALNNLKRWSNFSYAGIAMESIGVFSAETNSCMRCGMRRNSRISLSTSRSSDDSSKCWMDVFLSLFKKTRIAWNWRRCSVARNKNWKLDSQDIAPEPDQSSKKSKTTEHPYHEGELLLLKWHWIPPKHFCLELSLQSPHGVDPNPDNQRRVDVLSQWHRFELLTNNFLLPLRWYRDQSQFDRVEGMRLLVLTWAG